MKRKVYDRQFKIAAVKVALEEENTISQVANELGINGNDLRRWISEYEEKENILNRVFKADKKNKIWVGDITYIHTKHGFLYLSIFIDIFSRKVVGWAMDTRIKENLVLAALE